MMPITRTKVLESLWKGADPFAERSAFRGRVDFQGWASDNILLLRAVEEVRPQVVIEVGVWKGGSVLTMAERIRALALDGVVIAIDTWLGASEHWLDPAWFGSLRTEAGYPTLFRTFAANVLERGLEDYVVPLPLDSLNAAVLAKHYGLQADVLHIDGGHDYQSVLSDLRAWWPLLRQGGILLGDDYHAEGNVWPEVRAAFHDFFQTDRIENLGGKCYIRKT